MRLDTDDFCFACGRSNPHGLRLDGFRLEGDSYAFDWTPEPHFQGWPRIVHGGIITTVLDEAVTRLLWEQGIAALTAEISVRFLRPLPVNTGTRVQARMTDQRGRLIHAEAAISDADGEYARARVTMLRVEHA